MSESQTSYGEYGKRPAILYCDIELIASVVYLGYRLTEVRHED